MTSVLPAGFRAGYYGPCAGDSPCECLTPLNVPIDRTFTLRSVVRCGAGFGTHTVMLVRTGTLVAVDAPLLCVMNLGVTGELDIDADQARGIPEDRRPSSGQELVLDPDCGVPVGRCAGLLGR